MAEAKGLIVAAPATGQGKTTLTLGLIAALRARGQRVAALKVGPDFIDPGFHYAAGATASFNLDHWAMRTETRAALIAKAADGADLVVAEGMMGLFDGAIAGGGSTADIAAETGWPVFLAIDASAQGQSIAALAQGFARFRSDVRVAGVVLTKVGGAPHRKLLAAALAGVNLRVFGMVAHDRTLAVPERHLGLVQAREHKLHRMMANVRDAVAAGVDLDALCAAASPARPGAAAAPPPVPPPVPPLGRRIAVADDAAFAFAYEYVLAGWRAAGADILRFSPLADEGPPPDCDAVYLPGGYPELHVERLANAQNFRVGVYAAAARGAAVYGECGGYMTLGDALIDAEGASHTMLGLLPVTTSFFRPALQIGYRTMSLAADTPLGPAGARFRGQEFHYSAVSSEAATERLFQAADADGTPLGPAGLRRGSVFGSYLHVIDAA